MQSELLMRKFQVNYAIPIVACITYIYKQCDTIGSRTNICVGKGKLFNKSTGKTKKMRYWIWNENKNNIKACCAFKVAPCPDQLLAFKNNDCRYTNDRTF